LSHHPLQLTLPQHQETAVNPCGLVAQRLEQGTRKNLPKFALSSAILLDQSLFLPFFTSNLFSEAQWLVGWGSRVTVWSRSEGRELIACGLAPASTTLSKPAQSGQQRCSQQELPAHS